MGRRILEAIAAEERTQTSVETSTTGSSKGYLSRVIYGSRGTSIDPEKIRALADELHVTFEWLFIGRGPMRRDGREKTTPAEEAIFFARRTGSREDAIRLAWERNKDRVASLSASDWIIAIDVEARRLERDKVPRPEDVAKEQESVRKKSAILRELSARAAAFDAEVRAFLRPSATG